MVSTLLSCVSQLIERLSHQKFCATVVLGKGVEIVLGYVWALGVGSSQCNGQGKFDCTIRATESQTDGTFVLITRKTLLRDARFPDARDFFRQQCWRKTSIELRGDVFAISPNPESIMTPGGRHVTPAC